MNNAIDMNLMTGNIELLAEAIAIKLGKMPPIEKVVWDPQDSADYLKISKTYLLNHMQFADYFPTPINYRAGSKRASNPKWFAGEVIKFAEKSKVKS